jgi:hypothetical protein
MYWRPAALGRRIYPDRQGATAIVFAPIWRLAPAVFLLCLAVAGCAQRDSGPQEDRQGGFYGGVNGGITRP